MRLALLTSTLIPALLLGCGDPQPTVDRAPPIEPVEVRCGPTRLPALSQPRRLLPLPGDRLGVLGLRRQFDAVTGAELPAGGAWVTLDSTGEAPPMVERTEHPLLDGVVKGDTAYVLQTWPSEFEGRSERTVVRRPLARFGDAEAVVPYGDGDWSRLTFGFGAFIAGGGQSHASPERAGWIYTNRWGNLNWAPLWGPRLWRDLRGEARGLLWLPDIEQLITLGWRRALDDPEDDTGPGESFGSTITFGYTLDPRWTEPVIRPLAYKLHPQLEFDPVGAVLDLDGAPWLLAIERPTGSRSRRTLPFMVRFDPDTHQWTARIDPAPPAPATRGAVLDAVSLADGGWIIGGAACDEGRAWCMAWVARLDRRGRTVWSREAARESTMAVRDLHVEGGRIYAAIAGGPGCCQFDAVGASAWLWTLDVAGNCAEPPL